VSPNHLFGGAPGATPKVDSGEVCVGVVAHIGDKITRAEARRYVSRIQSKVATCRSVNLAPSQFSSLSPENMWIAH
jgi:hypothetical protein